MLEPITQRLPQDTASSMLALLLTVNDRPVEAEVEPRTILLDFLRGHLGLTGAKRSCDLQVCGACTVLVDGTPVSSCCTLAYEANGKAVETIEGLARYGQLHPIQDAFIRSAALQCGYCTPGMILATNPPDDQREFLAEMPLPIRLAYRLVGKRLYREQYSTLFPGREIPQTV